LLIAALIQPPPIFWVTSVPPLFYCHSSRQGLIFLSPLISSVFSSIPLLLPLDGHTLRARPPKEPSSAPFDPPPVLGCVCMSRVKPGLSRHVRARFFSLVIITPYALGVRFPSAPGIVGVPRRSLFTYGKHIVLDTHPIPFMWIMIVGFYFTRPANFSPFLQCPTHPSEIKVFASIRESRELRMNVFAVSDAVHSPVNERSIRWSPAVTESFPVTPFPSR